MKWSEYKDMKSIDLDVVPHVVHDVLCSDFGVDDEWGISARDAMLAAIGKADVTHVKVPIHPDALVGLGAWLSEQGYSLRSDAAAERRLARLKLRTIETLLDYDRHAWFCGRALVGTESALPSITAWFDAGVLRPTFHQGMRPVALHPSLVKTGSGINVCKFTMEEVRGWH